ncbi:MAG TPA: hypothetical protein G4N94_07695 [Caldilineae bacterium]|nr:hypothetical protein [Caldilineae bacterium]
MTNQPSKLGKVLRWIAIILLGLAAALHLLEGIGTTCVALWPEKFGPFAVLADYKWLYMSFVIAGLALGIAGFWATVQLARKKLNSYRNAVIILVLGLIASGIHVFASVQFRGSGAPTDMILYATIIVLIYFLILRIPGIWQKVGFESADAASDNAVAGGVAAILAGGITLTSHFWAAPSHTAGGVNYADDLHLLINVVGWGLIVLGIISLAWAMARTAQKEEAQAALSDA